MKRKKNSLLQFIKKKMTISFLILVLISSILIEKTNSLKSYRKKKIKSNLLRKKAKTTKKIHHPNKLKFTNNGQKRIVNYTDLAHLNVEIIKNKRKKEFLNHPEKIKKDREITEKLKNDLHLNSFTNEGITYFPYIIKHPSKKEVNNHFPNQTQNSEEKTSDKIKNFVIGFAIGFGLNAEANSGLYQCFDDKKTSIEEINSITIEILKNENI